MTLGKSPDKDRREYDPHQHVARVWAAPIADLDPAGLFQFGTACLDLAEATAEPERCTLLCTVAFSLLEYAGTKDQVIGSRIARICDREKAVAEYRPEMARLIAKLAQEFSTERHGTDPTLR